MNTIIKRDLRINYRKIFQKTREKWYTDREQFFACFPFPQQVEEKNGKNIKCLQR
ncbi:hypothetical protein [Pseudolactococcus yaeyamensis]